MHTPLVDEGYRSQACVELQPSFKMQVPLMFLPRSLKKAKERDLGHRSNPFTSSTVILIKKLGYH